MAMGRKGERAKGRNGDGATAAATKWLNRIAQGFYEAELVKAALLKSIFLKYCLVWTATRRQGTYDWLFGA
jgi:hypothetical protein